MSDGTFVEAMEDAIRKPVVLSVDGLQRLVVPSGWAESRREVQHVGAMIVGTLTSFADYVRSDIDVGSRHMTSFVHVEDPGRVAYKNPVEMVDDRYRRNVLMAASTGLVGTCPISPGTFYDPETFVVGLQAWFVEDRVRNAVLQAVGNLRDSTVTTATDDGVTQSVVAAKGVLVERRDLPGAVTLRPYRTFREVEQPASTFILRARAGKEGGLPTLALFEADGLAWKLEAMKNVADYLRAALPGVTVLA